MLSDFDGMSPLIADSAFVFKDAHVIGNVEIGEDSTVWPGSVVRGDLSKITIGQRTAIEDNCVLHIGPDPLVIGDDVLIGHGVIVHCKRIGSGVLVGSGSVVLDEVEIGEDSIIGAGAVIAPRTVIPPRSLVMGVPGKVVKQVSEERIKETRQSTELYVRLGKQYKEQGF